MTIVFEWLLITFKARKIVLEYSNMETIIFQLKTLEKYITGTVNNENIYRDKKHQKDCTSI